jgi:O-antigen ligase
MTASTARLGAQRSAGLGLGIAGLALFAVLSGVGIAMGEFEAMIISLSVIACCAVLADFRVGAVLLILMLPIEQSRLFPHSILGFTGLNPLNLVLGATLASFLLRGRDLGRFMPKPLLWLFIVPILLAGLLGVRHVDEIYPAFYEAQVIHFTDAFGYFRDTALKPMLIVLSALVIGAAVARSQKPERFLAPVILSVWVMSLISIIYVVLAGVSLGLLASSQSREFFAALGLHSNDLGRLYAVAYALLLFTWGETRDMALKALLVVTMGVLTLALLLTFSRGAFIGFVVVNALYLLWKFNARTVGIALLVLAAAMWLMPGAVVGRMMTGMQEDGGGDLNAVSAGRVDEIWLPLMPEVLKSPPWGNGLDSTMWSNAVWTQSMLEVIHPHNAYIQVILDMGLIGLGLLLAYYWHVFRQFKDLGSNAYLSPTMRGFYQGAVAGLVCFLITGISGSSLRPMHEFTFLWIAIGMMYGQLARRTPGQ